MQRILLTTTLPSGVTAYISGQSEEMRDSFASLQLTLVLAVFLVYLVMASQFESLVHPFVILLTIPLAVIGAVWALWLTGTTVNVVAYVLVDAARARDNEKRGGGRRVSLEEARALSAEADPDVLVLDGALQTLDQAHPRKARVVEMRFFGGLSIEETAAALQISVDTVK